MLAQDSGNEVAKAFHRVGHRGHRIGTRLASSAKQVAEKCGFRPSGVKTPEENAAFMSCLKARPTKLKSFSAACKAASRRSCHGRAEARPSELIVFVFFFLFFLCFL